MSDALGAASAADGRVPFLFDYINRANSYSSPSTVHAKGTELTAFFRRYLAMDALSVFDFTLPDWWSAPYVMYLLICNGKVAVIETDRWGVIPQGCGLGGYTAQYQPSYVTIGNPLLRGIKQLTIDRDAALIQLQPDYGGILDLIEYYADQMALASEALGVNMVNSKLAYVFGAKNQAQANSFKVLYDRVASGEPAVVVHKGLVADDGSASWLTFTQDLNSNFIAPKIMDVMAQIIDRFHTAVGIPNANTAKRERLNADEVNANNVETASKPAVWLESMRKGMESAHRLFGLTKADLWVDWRVRPVDTTGADQTEEVAVNGDD